MICYSIRNVISFPNKKDKIETGTGESKDF